MTTAIELIKLLYNEGFFGTWKTIQDVKDELTKKGFNLSDQLILFSLNIGCKKEILSRKTEKNRAKYAQKAPPKLKIEEGEITELNNVLSEITQKKLGDRFQQDIRELNVAFTNDCGSSAAFLLRKIIEKSIFYVFATNNKTDLLKNKDNTLIRLQAMLDLCAKEKILGIPMLLPKTVEKLSGVKLLGDSAAHDYLIDIEVVDINHQLPIWTVAIKELCGKLQNN